MPIVNVEVFVVVLDLDDDGTDDTVNWARTTEGGLYLWTDGAVLCDDGTTDGSSGYMVQIQPDGSGADFFAYDGCQEQGTSGCTFDANGNDLVCGGCSWNETVIVCASN